MGNTLHNKIYLGRHKVLSARGKLGAAVAVAVAAVAIGMMALR